jgi:hypothetical protein
VAPADETSFDSVEPKPSQPSKKIKQNVIQSSPGDVGRQSNQLIKIAMGACGIGLLILALSPLFRWINFGGGGFTGIAGSGIIILAVTVFCIILYAVAAFTGKQFVAVSLAVGAWGTVSVFWMGSLIYQIGSIFKSSEVKDNPFVAIFATQITPGIGLYLGLIGGLITASAFAYLAVQRLQQSGRLWSFYTVQTGALAVGVLVAILVGPGQSSSSSSETSSNTAGVASWFSSDDDAASSAAATPRSGAEDESNGERPKDDQPSEAELAARRAYAENIVLRDIQVGESILGEDGVYGELKNTGDRTLSEVEITVYSLDSQGQPIADTTHYPVRESGSGWSTRRSIPLRPNYAQKFGYKINGSSDWSGEVRVEVTNLVFAAKGDHDNPLESNPEKNAYFPSLEIRKLEKGENVLGEAGVFGEVKNTGHRALNKIEIIIYCLDDTGQRVYEKHYYPILVSEDSFSIDPDKPLKPNYTEEFGCKMDDAPSDWSGDVEVVVYDLEFAQ